MTLLAFGAATMKVAPGLGLLTLLLWLITSLLLLTYGGHMKFKKTCKQLAAYDIAIQQTLGLKVSQAAILVSTPLRTQIFKISRRYLDLLHNDWYKIVEEYYKQVDNCNVYDPDLI
jgi:hypothetical protein